LVVSASAVDEAPMNVLIIQTDEHNFRTLGCYRDLMAADQAFIWGEGVKVETPNIDWLAENGAICDRFYATSPVCTPSRAALMTGLYPQNTGSISNNLPMKDEMVTFAEELRRRGYATGYAGKWHLDGDAKPGWAPERKFGFEDNRYMFNRGHWKKLGVGEDGPMVAAVSAKGEPSYGLDGADEKSFTTDFLADRTIDFIRLNRNKPFCYMVSIPDPHGPNTVRAPYDAMFDPAPFKQPVSAQSKGKRLPSFASVLQDRFNARQMALYFGMVRCIDDNIGKILDQLREFGILERTLIVFTSDHGDMCGEHGRHNKGIPCEGSARIPFIVHAPGRIPAGRVVHEALGTVDFKPTLLGLLEVESGADVEGRDASALLTGGKPASEWRDVAFVRIGQQGEKGNGWIAAFNKQFKLVISPSADPGFFDLEKDPNELTNGFHLPRYRDTIRELALELEAYAKQYQEPHYASAAVKADLEWAARGKGGYTSPDRPSAKVKKAKP
jgi:arylsulfatase A-like enzyme